MRIVCMKNLDLNVVEYSHSAGFQSYREGLAGYYAKIGIELNPEKEIMITTGGSEALIFAFQCCFEAGDEIIIPTYVCDSVIQAIHAIGARCGGGATPHPITSHVTGINYFKLFKIVDSTEEALESLVKDLAPNR